MEARRVKEVDRFAEVRRLRLWTYHPSPLPDESLSSWFYRVAMGNATQLYTFNQIHWPHLAWSMWQRDVDRQSLPEVIEVLARGTGTDLERARQTGIASLEDIIFEKIDPISKMPFLLRIGVRSRSRSRGGQQFCPICLGEGEPYYRLRWRFAFATSCLHHGVVLRNQCLRCGESISFHRSRHIHRCYRCDFDLKDSPRVEASWVSMNLEQYLDDVIVRGQGELGAYGPVRSKLIFAALQQIFRVLSNGWRASALRDRVVSLLEHDDREVPPLIKPLAQGMEFELRSVSERHHLLHLATWLMTDWPARFIASCKEVGIWHSRALKDGTNLPWFYVQPVREQLFKPRYAMSLATHAHARQRQLFPDSPQVKKPKWVVNPVVARLRYELETRQLDLPLDVDTILATEKKNRRGIRELRRLPRKHSRSR